MCATLAAAHRVPVLCACSEVLPVVWTSLLRSISMTGKNTQQIMQAIVGKVRMYHKLLAEYATTGKRELGLLLTVQVGSQQGDS